MEDRTVSPAVALAFFAIGTFLLALLYRNELLLFAVMLGFSAIHLAYGRWAKVRRFVLATLVGGACENIAVAFGIWTYSNAHYLPAPLWAPVGWGMAALLFDEAFPGAEGLRFSWKALTAALAGTLLLRFVFANELLTLLGFVVVTVGFFLMGYLKKEELAAGICAGALATAMETINILSGNWHYAVAMLGPPLWLPLAWFDGFLIMRRIMRFGEKI